MCPEQQVEGELVGTAVKYHFRSHCHTDDRENEVSAVGVNDGHFLNDIDKTQPAEEASQADKASLHQEGKDQGGDVAMQPLRSELHLQSRDDQAGTQSVKRKLRYPLAVLCIQKAGADCCKASWRTAYSSGADLYSLSRSFHNAAPDFQQATSIDTLQGEYKGEKYNRVNIQQETVCFQLK